MAEFSSGFSASDSSVIGVKLSVRIAEGSDVEGEGWLGFRGRFRL